MRGDGDTPMGGKEGEDDKEQLINTGSLGRSSERDWTCAYKLFYI